MMKSMVLTEYKRLEIQDMPMPEVGPRDVRIRVSSCGICGSDVHGFDGSSGRRIPPLIMGHEAAGTIVGGVRAGERPRQQVLQRLWAAAGRQGRCARAPRRRAPPAHRDVL